MEQNRLCAALAITSLFFYSSLYCPPRRPTLTYNQAMARYEKAMAQVRKHMAEAERYKKLADTIKSKSAPAVPVRTPIAREKSAQEKIMLHTPQTLSNTPAPTLSMPTPPTLTQTTYSPDYLEAHAKKLQTEADYLDSTHPMNLGSSGMQKIEDYRLIAAALRSHAQQMRVPASPITEYALQTATPHKLEALAAKREQEKIALEQINPTQRTLQDYERKKELGAEIAALRAQAELIRRIQK